MADMTKIQRQVVKASIDDMVRHRRTYADTLAVSPRADVRRRMAEAGWLENKGRFAKLTREAFEAVGRLDVYPGTVTPVAKDEGRALGGVAEPPAPTARVTVQEHGRTMLRLLEPPVVLDLPPLAQRRDLVRINDIAPAPASGSTVVALIERVWDRIRAEHPDLPHVVVTTGSGEFVKWGHFRPDSWKSGDEKLHEFFLASEALAKGAVQVLQTTIHEAAHTLARARGQKDTSRQNRYHNKVFLTTAEELGLEHRASTPDKTHGFSFVTLTEATKEKYADLLDELTEELVLTGLLPFWLGGADEEDEKGGEKIVKPKGGEKKGKTQSGNLKAMCRCANIVRLSRKILEKGVVRCDECEELFLAE